MQMLEPSHKLLLQHEPGIRFILNDMPHTNALWPLRTRMQLLLHAIALQIHPTHNAANERVPVG